MTAIMDARTAPELNDAFKAAVRVHVAYHGCNPFDCSAPDLGVLSEEWRRWHVRDVARRDGHRPKDPSIPRPPSVPRVKLHEQLAKPNDDGTITCTGSCGETKPAKAFPTVKGAIGRGNVCRACQKERRDQARIDRG